MSKCLPIAHRARRSVCATMPALSRESPGPTISSEADGTPNHLLMNERRPPRRQLGDVLRDPDASWKEIREAMKSSRGCTNAAVIGAIARGSGVAVVGPEDIGHSGKRTGSDAVGAAEPSSEGKGAGGEGSQRGEAPPKDKAKMGTTNGHNPQAARQANDRASLRGSKISPFRRSRHSWASLRTSVNMMDFGVDQNKAMGILDEIASLDDAALSMRDSISDNSTYCSGSGFLDWNRDDECIFSSMRSSGARSNYSDLVDSSGFLDWDRRVDSSGFLDWDRKKTQPEPPPDTHRRRVINGPASEVSFTDTCANEQWDIEDYENPQDHQIKRSRGNFFTHRLKRFSGIDQVTPANSGEKEEITMGDVKEALMKVANSAGATKGCKSAPGSRRGTLEGEDPSGINGEDIKEAARTAGKPPRRRTIIGMPNFNFLGGGESKSVVDRIDSASSNFSLEDNGPTRRRRSKSDDGSMDLLFSIEKAIKNTGHNSSSGISFFSPSDKPRESDNIWGGGAEASLRGDSREAIWINRKDGDVDIEKECRKLYSEDRPSVGGRSLSSLRANLVFAAQQDA